MINIVPVITWDGTDAILLGRTLKSVREFQVVHLWTTETYRNTHRVISTAGISGTDVDLKVFEVSGHGPIGRIKNQAIQEVYNENNEAYLTFMKAGDLVRVTPESDDIGSDPMYLGETLGEYQDGAKLYEILEDSYPISTLGLIIQAKWFLEEKLDFDNNTEFSFIRKLFYEYPQRLYTMDFVVESGSTVNLDKTVACVKSLDLDPDTDTDYYKCRHTLARLILDSVRSGKDVSKYFEYAYPEKRI
jgi:hypothetical protein